MMRHPARFEILAGLPTYGALALPFPPDGRQSHSEGIVVRFQPEAADAWVGNFQRGHTRFDAVLAHPDQHHILVIAGGAGYVIDPERRQQTRQGKTDMILSSGQIMSAEYLPDLCIILLSDASRLGVMKASGVGWTCDWNWDMRDVVVEGHCLRARIPLEGNANWVALEVDLNTGECTSTTRHLHRQGWWQRLMARLSPNR